MKKEKGLNGAGCGGVLSVVFIILKLTKVIDWSWWWVLSTVWIPLIIAVLIFIGFMVGIIIKMYKEREGTK